MQILENNDSPWITAIIDGRWVQAKVYNEPSPFGINEGRISKLAIGKTDFRDRTCPFDKQIDYNYDRGLDFNNMTSNELESIVDQLEALPVRYTPNI